MVSRHLVVFRPVAAVGNEVALSTKMDVLMAREAAEWRELDTMEHDGKLRLLSSTHLPVFLISASSSPLSLSLLV